MSRTNLLLRNIMAPVLYSILDSGYSQVLGDEDDVKRYQVTIGYRLANESDL